MMKEFIGIALIVIFFFGSIAMWLTLNPFISLPLMIVLIVVWLCLNDTFELL